MAAAFIGRHVSINCGTSLGFFQGIIKSVDATSQTISIGNPYKNGIQCQFSEITLASQDIVDLTLIDELNTEAATEVKSNKQAIDSSSKKLPGDKGSSKTEASHSSTAKRSLKDVQFSSISSESFPSAQSQSPPRLTHSFREQRHSNVKDGRPQPQANRLRAGSYRHQDDCFAIDYTELSQDFDFEKNLALFDKQALYEEVYSGSDGEVRTPVKSRKNKPVPKYRHDENVLESRPTVYRQIIIKDPLKSDVIEYYTDSGLVIPCISSELHNRVCAAAMEMGISLTRQIEIFGANASQMALNLVGGSSRLHPRNAHQCPHVVVFTGPHLVGAQGIATARHLANQNVQVDVFLDNLVKMNDYLQEELKLLSLTDARFVNDVKDLPQSPVDLVITAVDDDHSAYLRTQAWYDSATRWCTANLAPIMCLCPPEEKLGRPSVSIRWSVCSVLPRSLSSSYGSIYLLDLALPPKVFRKAGIKYRSPFCAKPFIALHTSR